MLGVHSSVLLARAARVNVSDSVVVVRFVGCIAGPSEDDDDDDDVRASVLWAAAPAAEVDQSWVRVVAGPRLPAGLVVDKILEDCGKDEATQPAVRELRKKRREAKRMGSALEKPRKRAGS